MTGKELCAIVVKQHSELFCNLYERWQDEKEYEDINDYLKAFQKVLPTAYAITKRPFGIKLKADDMNVHIFVKTKGNYLTLSGKKII